jgi:predicted nucleic acid-binding Zn ribbon protein
MKKCAYCGKDIQEDEAFCIYCGLGQGSKHPKSRPWTFSRVILLLAAIFLCCTGLGAIGGIIGYFAKPKDRIKGAFSGALIACLVAIIVIPGLLFAGPLIGNIISSGKNFLHSSPTVISTLPSSTPVPCYAWSQITLDMEGEIVCMEGTVAQVYSQERASSRINFTTMPNTFFLVSAESVFYYWENGTRNDVTVGDCVQATETVKVFDDGLHQISYMQISSLYHCTP